MKWLVVLFAVSVLAVSCAVKSSEQVSGSEAAGKPLGGITIGAVFSISTDGLRKAVQKSVDKSTVLIGDQLKYFGPSRRNGLHQFQLIGNLEVIPKRDLTGTLILKPYVANLTPSVVEQLKHFPVSQESSCDFTFISHCLYVNEWRSSGDPIVECLCAGRSVEAGASH